MPLVTITTAEQWHPTSRAGLVYELGENLPTILIDLGDQIFLDDDTPLNAVQVKFEQYGEFDINIVDVWVFILFTEDPGLRSNEELDQAKRRIVAAILNYLQQNFPVSHYGSRPEMALDVFWGPGHGSFIDYKGTIILDW